MREKNAVGVRFGKESLQVRLEIVLLKCYIDIGIIRIWKAMLALTKKTGYALVAMAHLANIEDGKLASAREIAEQFGVPVSLLMNVLKELAANGYIKSVRGAHGGYRLARRVEDINLAEVVSSLEGPVRLAQCVTRQSGDEGECTCEVMARCPVTDPVHRAQRRLNDFLRKVTLSELLQPRGGIENDPSEPAEEPDKKEAVHGR